LQEAERDYRRSLAVNIIAKQSEFIATQSGQQVAGANSSANSLRDDSQDLVPNSVAVEVVDAFEVVKVYQEKRMLSSLER
jgi:hypothetical protein